MTLSEIKSILNQSLKSSALAAQTVTIQAISTLILGMKFLISYQKNYWQDFAEEARELALKYLNEGKIDFPRLRGEAMPFIAFGHWVNND